MRMLRTLAAFAFLLICAPAFAQWQTPNHSVPLGRGAGTTGFGSAAPGVAGQPFVSQGASSDPAFGTIANSGFTAGAADTYKGSLNGSTVADVPFPNCQSINSALRYVPGSGPACGTVSVTTGYDMPINLGLSAPAPSGGALVINLTQANGNPPTSSNPVLVPFRSTALATGTVTWSTIAATQSITIPSGATLGTSNGVPFRVWIFEDYNSGTPELGVATCSNPTNIFACSSWESTLVTSTTISGSATAAGTLYTTTGVTLDAVRIIGYCEFASGVATAGSWTSSCTTLQVFGPGIKKPGDSVQKAQFSTSTPTNVTTTTKTATSLTGTITPTSAANLIYARASGYADGGQSTSFAYQLYRGTGTTAFGSIQEHQTNSSIATSSSILCEGFDQPGVVTSTQYGLYGIATNTGTDVWLDSLVSGTTPVGVMFLEEIMG